ncbi:MAG: glutamine--tRNA ligase, partial [Clostridia bacterium]|nr:glutamine--tRNA ligase [Clostridia bacterium]
NDYLNPDSAVEVKGAIIEKDVDMTAGAKYQFVRLGYYVADSKHPGTFNRIVSLKDSFKPE